jgi:ABC-type multidrug transport system fused ATPase/permease subunit
MAVCLALSAPLGVISPVIIQRLIDQATAGAGIEDLLLWGGALAGLTLVTLLFDLGGGYARTLFDNLLIRDLRLNLYLHMQRLSLSYYSRHETGSLLSRQVDDVGNLQGVMAGTFVRASVDLAMAIVYCVLLFWLEWRLALGAVTLAALIFVLEYAVSDQLRRRTRKVRERWTDVSRVVHQAISGQYLVRATAAENREAGLFRRVLQGSIRANIDKELFSLVTGNVFGLIGSLTPTLIIVFGVYLIVTGSLSVGELFAFFMYLGYMFGAVAGVAQVNPVLQSSLASLERIYEVLDTEPEVIVPGAGIELPTLRGEVVFEHVSFGYEPGRLVLRDIDVRVRARQVVALVGPSGSGKSTLAHLVPRFFEPTSGRVLIDGEDLQTLDLSWLRRHIGVVPQQVFLFDRTIAENLAYGRPGASMDEIREAARAANAIEFIEALPEGFDTAVGERGSRLSGGQRQRLAIAREILSDPAILILDEATSALDSATEALIQRALKSLLKDRTAFVIAHRLSTIVDADLILVLDQGRVVESGIHDELLALGGLYARLCESQFLGNADDQG